MEVDICILIFQTIPGYRNIKKHQKILTLINLLFGKKYWLLSIWQNMVYLGISLRSSKEVFYQYNDS